MGKNDKKGGGGGGGGGKGKGGGVDKDSVGKVKGV